VRRFGAVALALLGLAGCGVHLGRPPSAFRVARLDVEARTAEPGVAAALEGAMRRVLVEQGAWGTDGVPLTIEVVSAGWGSWITGGAAPSREVVLVVRARRGADAEEVVVRRVVPVDATAGEGVAVRAAVLAGLAAEVADTLVARWSSTAG
jgi:hypothetical protein